MQRLSVVLGHLLPGVQGSPGTGAYSLQAAPCSALHHRESPEDIVVVHGLRTAICKAKRGAFKDTTPDELLSAVMAAVLKDVNLEAAELGDVCVGNVLQPGAGAFVARVAQFLGGFPESVPVYCVNRQCSSGLQAVINVAGGIRNGSYDIGLACGVESMTLRSASKPGDVSSRMLDHPKAKDCIIPMGKHLQHPATQDLRFTVQQQRPSATANTKLQR